MLDENYGRNTFGVFDRNRGRDVFEDYARRTFTVKAVRVTEGNMSEVAKICGSYSQTCNRIYGDRVFFAIHVERRSPLNSKCDVFIGDWATWANMKFRRYNDEAFRATFTKAGEPDDDRLLKEHLTNPEIKARNETILQLVRRAVKRNGDIDQVVAEATHDIIRLLY